MQGERLTDGEKVRSFMGGEETCAFYDILSNLKVTSDRFMRGPKSQEMGLMQEHESILYVAYVCIYVCMYIYAAGGVGG